MTTLDLTPAAGAAPAARRVLSHGLLETRLLVRNGEQLLLALVIPIAILVGGRVLSGPSGELATLAPSVLGLAIWSSAFTSVAIATGFERRYGVLERLAATPLGRTGLLLGKCAAVTVVVVGQLIILAGTAIALGWRPTVTPPAALAALATGLLAGATFVALALLLASRLRAEVTLAVANLVYVVMLAGGALLVPLARYPAAMRPVVELLPTAALGEGLRSAALGQPLGWPFLVLLGWLVLAGLLVRKGFRWTS
jgi:ABC-2 type transport system permease protein